MSESEKSLPNTLITLELDTGPRDFTNIEELQKWVSEERSFFSWLEAGSKKDGNASQIWANTHSWLRSVEQFIVQYPQVIDDGQRKNHIRELKKNIINAKSRNDILTSKNPIAIFGKNLSESEDEVVASYAMHILLNKNINLTKPEALLGAFKALRYREGSIETVDAQMAALEALKDDWEGKFRTQHQEHQSQTGTLIEEIGNIKEKLASTQAQINAQLTYQKKSFDAMTLQAEKNFHELEKTYDEKLALQSSVKYWTDKKARHGSIMFWVGFITVLLAFGTGYAVIDTAKNYLQVKPAEVQLWHLGLILAISTIGIWLTRISAKIFISNLHLRTDADERVTMMQAYLALLRSSDGLEDDDRQLILQTLFRPSTTGIIKDDGPIAFHEVITKKFGSQ